MSKRRLGLIKRPSAGGITDPTDIANCVAWVDLSDAAFMTFSGSAVDTFTDKVNSCVYTKTSASNEYQHSVNHLAKLDDQPRYGSVYSSNIICTNFTFIVLFQQAGDVVSGFNYLFKSGTSALSVATDIYNSVLKKYTFTAVPGTELESTTSTNLMAAPISVAVTGGIGESQAVLFVENTQEDSVTESKSITLSNDFQSVYSSRTAINLMPYQFIVYDRVLTTQEMIDIHAWLDTKK